MSELGRARADAVAAKARLTATAGELCRRLQPAVLADNALDAAKRKGEAIAEEARDAVRKRPVAASAAAAGVASLLGVALFARFRRSGSR